MELGKLKKKNKTFELIFILIISLIFSLVLFKSNIYAGGHDLTFHLNRLVGICDAFEDGQILPKIYPYSNNGFGYASPLFYCDLFLYPFALLYKLGVSLIVTYKVLLLCLSFGTSTIVFYCAKKVFKRNLTPYTATMLYVFSSYHFYDVYARAAIGETFGIMFTPLVLYSIYKILVLKKNDYILLGISFSCLVMSHLISALLIGIVFALCIMIYIINNKKRKQEILNTLLCIVKGTALALLLCAWFILPMLEQMHSQKFYLNIVDQTFDVNSSTCSIKTIFSLFARLDINGKNINSVISIGILLLIIPVIYTFIKKNSIINLCLFFVFISFLFILGVFRLPSLLSNIQFLFRMYIIVYPLLTIVSAYVLDNINTSVVKYLTLIVIIYSLANLTIFTTDLNQDNNHYFSNNESVDSIFTSNLNYNLDYNNSQLGGGEYLPICNNEDYLEDNLTIVVEPFNPDINIEIKEYTRNGTSIKFELDSQSEYAILPLTYYKGYCAYCDGIKIKCVEDTVFAKVGIYLESGDHEYEVKYEGTFVQKASLILSCISFITMLYIITKKTSNRI